MNPMKWTVPCIILPIAFIASCVTPSELPAEPGRQRLALLIGCTEYPLLPTKYALRGPGNDVALIKDLLIDRLDFSEKDIRILVHANKPTSRPTREAIEREFLRLANIADEDDSVFVFFAGHGCQRPDSGRDDPEDLERDGLDEVFLPEDVAAWDAESPDSKAIADDEIRMWLNAIRDKGADVLFVADSCHSGSLDRGPAEENGYSRSRFVDPTVVFGPEAKAGGVSVPERPQTRTRESGIGELGNDDPPKAGTLVSFYAVPANQLEKEHPMPPNERFDDPYYGRLSFAFARVLHSSEKSLTYREVAQRLRWQYEHFGWLPYCSLNAGEDSIDREVLGRTTWNKRSSLVISRQPDGSLRINEGSLHGVRVGSIYRVKAPDANSSDDASSGFVRVVNTNLAHANVIPAAHKTTEAMKTEDVPTPGLCEIVEVGAPDLRLSVQVVNAGGSEMAQRHEEVTQIIQGLAKADNALIELATNELPEVYLQVEPKRVVLRLAHASGKSGGIAGKLYGPYDFGQDLEPSLEKALRTIAKVYNLRRLVTEVDKNTSVSIEVVAEKQNPKTKKYAPLDSSTGAPELRDGDVIRLRVRNVGRKPVDVTILYIDSAFAIDSFLPMTKDAWSGVFDNRLLPKSELEEIELEIANATTGLEDVLVIATESRPGDPPLHFAFLAQEGLKNGLARGGNRSPLMDLVQAAAFGGGERGAKRIDASTPYIIHRLSWKILAGGQP